MHVPLIAPLHVLAVEADEWFLQVVRRSLAVLSWDITCCVAFLGALHAWGFFRAPIPG